MSFGETTSPEIERVAKQVVDSAFKVHSEIGPGALESIYELCLAHELVKRGLSVAQQVVLPVFYDGIQLDVGLQLDLIVEGLVIVEVKSVEKMIPVFDAQCLTYLKFSKHRLCLLINFNVKLIKDGIKRIVR